MATKHQRLDVGRVDPKAYQAVLAMEAYIANSGLDPQLYELIKIRASQLNGCAFCLDMHTHDARNGGEDQRRLDVLSAWREAPGLFAGAEQAALAFTEAVTCIADGGVSDQVWNDVAAHFDQNGIVHLLMAVSTINVWNRLGIAAHLQLPNKRRGAHDLHG
jgi:AhpD family alkylhydroperoxidase